MEKFKSQPHILIQVKGVGFTFLVDTSCKYNLVTPCFVDFFHEEYPPSQERLEYIERVNSHLPEEHPMRMPLYNFVDVFHRGKGVKKIKCKDGINRGCESITLEFVCNGKSYSELFYIDQSLCSFCTPKNQLSGLLGTEFLKRHKWIIDFNNLVLR